MIKNVVIPQYIMKGIVHNDIAFPKRLRVFGFDTETVKGEPYTFQCSRDGETADVVFVDADTILDKFIDYIQPKLQHRHLNVMYVHNLSFDLAVLLKKYQKLFVGNSKLKLSYRGVTFDFIIAKVYFGRIYFPGKRTLLVVDSYAFFTGNDKMSLGALAEQLKLKYQKIGHLKSIGQRRYIEGSPTYNKFIKYAKQDAIVEWHLGKWIISQYKKYNTRICVSAPQFSMRVFRHYFLRKGDCIQFPPPQAVRGCILSYHGGKNGYYVDGVNVVKKCYEIDVVSMYPYALKSMPNFLRGNYEYRSKFDPEHEGIYEVTGKINYCKYPVLFSHDFDVLHERADKVWVTSYELREAINNKEIDIESCEGYVWISDPKEFRNPFAEFVDFFFKLKDSAENPAEKLLAKIILNSLYGKMIQTIPDEDTKSVGTNSAVDKNAKEKAEKGTIKANYTFNADKGRFIENRGSNIFHAGGMFNPFIATLITGFARAYLHRLEHKYRALHSSTDSVKTTIPCKDDKRLGGIKIECAGKCILFRNKLYLHYQDYDKSNLDAFLKKHDTALHDKTRYNHDEALRCLRALRRGRAAEMLEKYALHGFIGRPAQLMKLFEKKKNFYYTNHMYKVREAFRQNKTPLSMERVKRELKGVDFNKVNYIN